MRAYDFTVSGTFQAAPSIEGTDVFVSGTEGYHTYRIPVVMATAKGTLLAFCEGRLNSSADHGNVDVVLKRSLDNGRTWGPLQVVWGSGDRTAGTAKDDRTWGNPAPVQDSATGRIWLPVCWENTEVHIMHSDDEGLAWSEPQEITSSVKAPDWGWYATGPHAGIELSRSAMAGRLVVPCDHVTNDKQWGSHVIYSDDQGSTWKLGGAARPECNESAVIEKQDGSLLINCRSGGGILKRRIATSADGGLTWTPPWMDGTLIEARCQGSLVRSSFGAEPGSNMVLFSNPATSSSRTMMTVRLSYDECASWPQSLLVYTGPAAYSHLVKLPNAEIGLLYERGLGNAYETIRFDWFPLSDLTGESAGAERWSGYE